MIIKVCGVTGRADAEAAIEAGATALGFNFYSQSPRYVAPELAAAIDVPAGLTRVGVFVNETPDRVARVAAIARLDAVQLHGEETPADYPPGIAVWKAARVGEGFRLDAWEECPADVLLLDGPAALVYGGAGIAFDWRIARASRKKIILAGGLDATNVAQAIGQARPWGVDACSRIEIAPGKKDHRKMKDFIQTARAAFSC